MKNQFIEEMLENLQNKVEELLEEVETMNNTGLSITGESIEDQILDTLSENFTKLRPYNLEYGN
jgi:effector-binding domain-containing protein